jgi:release factor glutamine methyltransferase
LPTSDNTLVLDALQRARRHLEKESVESPRQNAVILLSELLGIRTHELYVARQLPMDNKMLGTYMSMVERRAAGEPLAYIIGNVDFMGLKMSVRKGVFIPRPETELLCEIALEHLARAERVLVADICTGCGAIALALAEFHQGMFCYGTDISDEAMASARVNAERLGLSDRTSFLKGHLADPLRDLGLAGSLDCVTANPPYVRDRDLPKLAFEIREHEPIEALRGGEDGSALYPEIVDGAWALLKPGGLIALEISDTSADSVLELVHASRFTRVRVRDDLTHLPRFITGVRGK